MIRTCWFTFALLITGCQVAAERVQIMPLPEAGQPVPFPDLAQRARLQAAAANEAFYVDKWTEVIEAADALEKTARFLPKATDVPPRAKDKLAAWSDDLVKLTGQMRDAAKARDAKKSTEAITAVNLKVRELSAEK